MREDTRIIAISSIFPNCEEVTKGVYIFKQVEALSRKCHVEVIAPVPYFPSFLKGSRYSRYAKIPFVEKRSGLTIYHPRYLVIPKVGRSLYGMLYFLSISRLLLRLKREKTPHGLLGFWAYPDGFAVAMLSRLTGLPYAIGCRGCDVNNLENCGTVIRSSVKWTLRKSGRVFAVSSAMAGVIQAMEVDSGKIEVIPNGIDLEMFDVTSRESARERIPVEITPGEKVIIFCGRLSEEKGIGYLIDAVSLLKREGLRPRLLVIGDGPLLPDIRAAIRDKGIEDRVSLLGERPHSEVSLYICASDLLCLPSIREGWPNVVVESLACGVPVVASDVGGVPEIVTSPKFGTLVPPRDHEALALAIRASLETEWDNGLIKDAFRTRTWDHVAEEILHNVKPIFNNNSEETRWRSTSIKKSH